MNQTGISSYTEPQLAELVKEMGQPAFRAKQLFKWLHEKQARILFFFFEFLFRCHS